MVTPKKRKSNNAWDAANMTVLGCKVRKEYADQVLRRLRRQRGHRQRHSQAGSG